MRWKPYGLLALICLPLVSCGSLPYGREMGDMALLRTMGVDAEEEKLTAQVWQGPWCYDLCRVEDTAEFSLSEEGLAALRAWLERWAEEMNGRPRESLAETIARRDALLQEQSAQAAEQKV